MRFAGITWLVGLLTFAGPLLGAATPASIAVSGAASQVANVAVSGQTLTLEVIVKDSGGNVIPGASVTFSAPSTGATGTFQNGLHADTLSTLSVGSAIAILTTNTTPGTFSVFASTFGVNFQVLSVTFTITNIGGPAIITALPGTTPQAVLVGTAFQPLAVKITDAANYPLPGLSVLFGSTNIPITFGGGSTPGAGGAFSNGAGMVTVSTDASGIASAPFTANLVAGGPYSIPAKSGALSTAFVLTNTAVSVSANPGTTPQTAIINSAFAAPLAVTVRDANTNAAVSGVKVVFSAPGTGPSGIFGAPGTVILTPFTVTTNASGVASAPFTANSASGGPYTVTAAVGSFSAAFSLTNAPAGPASLTANPGSTPQSAVTGKAFSAPLAVTVKDVLGTPLSGINVTFSAPASGPSGVFSNTTGTITVATNASGTASPAFTANSASGGPYTVTASAGALSATFLLTNTAASSAPVITQNPTDLTVADGSTASFTAAATGSPAPSVQWQQSTGGPFTDVSGATSTTLTFTAANTQSGNQYRAVFSNSVSIATTTAATLTVQTLPAIRTVNPVIPSFLGNSGFSSNMYLEIYGSNFSTTTRLWSASDFNGLIAPTSLDKVSVKVNNKAAFVYFVSSGQININAPDDSTTNPVTIQVDTPNGLSNIVTVPRSRLSPSLQTTPQFKVGGVQYVVALTPDFKSFIGKPNLVAGASFVSARPGDIISIYALGAGPTNPPTQAGIIAAVNSPLALPFQLKIGGIQATVPFAGLLANTIGLYQLNVVIPQVPSGDQTIEFIVDGVPNNQNLFITVGP